MLPPLSLVVALFVTLPTFAASFDCSKAETPIDKAICTTPKLSALDDDLGAAYKLAMGSAVDKDKIKADGRNWIAQVRDKCSDVQCLATAYMDRIDEIRTIARFNLSRDAAAVVVPANLFSDFIEGLSGPNSNEVKNGLMVFSACAAHRCGDFESLIAIDEKNGAVFAALLLNDSVQTFRRQDGPQFPEMVNAWVRERQPQKSASAQSANQVTPVVTSSAQPTQSSSVEPRQPARPTVPIKATGFEQAKVVVWSIALGGLATLAGIGFAVVKRRRSDAQNSAITTPPTVAEKSDQTASDQSPIKTGQVANARASSEGETGYVGKILVVVILLAGFIGWKEFSPSILALGSRVDTNLLERALILGTSTKADFTAFEDAGGLENRNQTQWRGYKVKMLGATFEGGKLATVNLTLPKAWPGAKLASNDNLRNAMQPECGDNWQRDFEQLNAIVDGKLRCRILPLENGHVDIIMLSKNAVSGTN